MAPRFCLFICFVFVFSFKLVVVGGGAGGCSTAAKFASKLGRGQVAVIEPREVICFKGLG
jgi:NADH dehydrogenase FAD-containing subunit